MNAPQAIARSMAGSALAMSLVAFVLGSAAFTPALLLAVVAVPLSLLCLYVGLWRSSVVTLYWSAAAWLALPMSRWLPMRIDWLLVMLGIVGLIIAGLCLRDYRRALR